DHPKDDVDDQPHVAAGELLGNPACEAADDDAGDPADPLLVHGAVLLKDSSQQGREPPSAEASEPRYCGPGPATPQPPRPPAVPGTSPTAGALSPDWRSSHAVCVLPSAGLALRSVEKSGREFLLQRVLR